MLTSFLKMLAEVLVEVATMGCIVSLTVTFNLRLRCISSTCLHRWLIHTHKYPWFEFGLITKLHAGLIDNSEFKGNIDEFSQCAWRYE